MAAKVTIRVGVMTRTRANSDRWKETKSFTENWIINTHLDTAGDDLESALPGIWNYVQSQQSNLNNNVDIHYSVTFENTVAAPPPTGGWLQAKQHLDGKLADGTLTDVSPIRDTINFTISALKKSAKY